MSVATVNSIPVAFSASSKLGWRIKASILLNIIPTVIAINIYLPLDRWAASSSIFLFCWKKRDLAASGPKDSTEKWLGKKILPIDTQIRAGLLSPFRLTTESDWLHFLRQGCKQSWTVSQLGQDGKKPSSLTSRMALWEPWPHPVHPRAVRQALCCNQCSVILWSIL